MAAMQRAGPSRSKAPGSADRPARPPPSSQARLRPPRGPGASFAGGRRKESPCRIRSASPRPEASSRYARGAGRRTRIRCRWFRHAQARDAARARAAAPAYACRYAPRR